MIMIKITTVQKFAFLQFPQRVVSCIYIYSVATPVRVAINAFYTYFNFAELRESFFSLFNRKKAPLIGVN